MSPAVQLRSQAAPETRTTCHHGPGPGVGLGHLLLAEDCPGLREEGVQVGNSQVDSELLLWAAYYGFSLGTLSTDFPGP